MTSLATSSVLAALGYQVLSLDDGVYVLENVVNPDEPRSVALFLGDHAVSPMLAVKLFRQPVPQDVPAFEIVGHWKTLDARRFEETGLNPLPLELGPIAPADLSLCSYDRPGGGKRHAAVLATGDVVCFN